MAHPDDDRLVDKQTDNDRRGGEQDVVDESHDLAEPAAARVFGEKGAGRMPVGVPTSVAIAVIATLPAMAFKRPPLLPGGGVIWVNSAGPSALNPSYTRVNNIQASQKSPNAMVKPEMPSINAFTRRRLPYI